jgi:hypothetical protein
MILSALDKIPKDVFIIGGSIFLFLYCLTTYKSEIRFLSTGIWLLYSGVAMLYYYRKKDNKPSMAGLRFRMITAGIMGLLGKLYLYSNFSLAFIV